VYLDTSSSNGWLRYQTGKITLADVFRRALDTIGPSRILFGSDSSWFPRGWVHQVFDSQIAALTEAGANTEMIHAILGGNLRSLIAHVSAG
jgi:predicted TIM-barrel fold metal-dependent hydrolase